MAQRSGHPTLPNIHSTVNTKQPEFSDTTPSQSQSYRRLSSRSNFPSARSVDSTIRYNGVTTGSMPTALESLLPDSAGEDEHIDMGRIRIERKSHKALLPPSVCTFICLCRRWGRDTYLVFGIYLSVCDTFSSTDCYRSLHWKFWSQPKQDIVTGDALVFLERMHINSSCGMSSMFSTCWV